MIPARVWLVALLLAVVSAGASFGLLVASDATQCLRSWASIALADDEAFECDDRGLEGQLKAEGFAGSRETTAERQAAATETRAFLVAWMAFSAIAFGVATATAVVSWRARAVLKQMAEDEPQRPPVDRWREWRSRTFALWWPVILLALAGGGLIVSLRLRFSAYDKMHESMLVPLWLVLFVVSVPTIVTLSRSQLVLRALGRTDHRSLTHLRTVGALQRTLIVMIGAGLVIGFLALSARWQLVDTLPGGRALPGTLVFLFGGIFATAAAIAIAPPLHAWLSKVEEVAQKIVPGRRFDVGREPQLEELRTAFGARGGLRGGVLGGLAIFMPVALAALEALVA